MTIKTPAQRFSQYVENRFGVPVAGDHDVERLNFILECYGDKVASRREEIGESACTDDINYIKARMISEAARMVLREIAPKRTRRKSR
jgi:hypothetical protein